ncbi:helix-turn-helix transcriptional regulator [Streptomyces sp. NPDC051105]|uniref:response regulator transcription factor n=1 Tax=Streptomyces sp. NPDC051105 TaxID=3154843 RepID=UPI0034236ADA
MYGENQPTVENAGSGTKPGDGGGLAQVTRSALQELTPREREVLGALSNAEGNRALARRLGIAERTVKAHLTSITRKLGLRNRVEATLLSVQWADELRSNRTSPEHT